MNCNFCGKELKGKRIKWCSDKCQWRAESKRLNTKRNNAKINMSRGV